jgi:hypothetical protein
MAQTYVAGQFQRDEFPGGDFLECERRSFGIGPPSGAERHEGKNGEKRGIAGGIRQGAPLVFRGSADNLNDERDAHPKCDVKVRFPREPGARERNFLDADEADLT